MAFPALRGVSISYGKCRLPVVTGTAVFTRQVLRPSNPGITRTHAELQLKVTDTTGILCPMAPVGENNRGHSRFYAFTAHNHIAVFPERAIRRHRLKDFSELSPVTCLPGAAAQQH